jgi:hypothetical protein
MNEVSSITKFLDRAEDQRDGLKNEEFAAGYMDEGIKDALQKSAFSGHRPARFLRFISYPLQTL